MLSMIHRLSWLVLLAVLPTGTARAGEFDLDGDTVLLLHVNGDADGVQGETPTVASGLGWEPGVFGEALALGEDSQLRYLAADCIDVAQGTIEFWLKPDWNGGDGQGHALLRHGLWGGLLICKDGGDYWRLIVNRYGGSGEPERGVGHWIGDWQAGDWHHCAFTWSATELGLFIDGQRVETAPLDIALPAIAEETLQFGRDGEGDPLLGTVDELRVSDVVRGDEEILASYLAAQGSSGFFLEPAEAELYETWRLTPTPSLVVDGETVELDPAFCDWSSSQPAVAAVDAGGRVTALAAGEAWIRAEYDGLRDSCRVSVTAPVRPPVEETVPAILAEPPDAFLHDMPVVVIRFLPTVDGETVDAATAGWTSTLADLETRIETFDERVKFALTEGTRFRGWGDPLAPPSLGYRVVRYISVYEPLPPGLPAPGSPTARFPDYAQILERFDAQDWVEGQGVKEFWIWGYHTDAIAPVESNMSSPTTGDVSNSWRHDDLPVYSSTYVVYNSNFTRTQAEAVHNHGHQLEAILSHACWLQDGDTHLFWREFTGQNESGQPVVGRCGNTHMPPNTTVHYDYLNPTLVPSDVFDWRPGGGAQTPVNLDSWGGLAFDWPGEPDFPQRVETQWYVLWMQSMPGHASDLPFGADVLRDWWEFTADWDGAILAGHGLHREAPEPPVAVAVEIRVEAGLPRLEWTALGEGVSYRVESRGLSGDGGWQPLAETTRPEWTAAPGAPDALFRVFARR